ncbi:hypothetical protein CRM22_006553, partial [Opisthorchis felineus]
MLQFRKLVLQFRKYWVPHVDIFNLYVFANLILRQNVNSPYRDFIDEYLKFIEMTPDFFKAPWSVRLAKSVQLATEHAMARFPEVVAFNQTLLKESQQVAEAIRDC